MKTIAVTGPRYLTEAKQDWAETKLLQILKADVTLLVGDVD